MLKSVKVLFLGIVSFLFLYSCTSPIDKRIDRKNASSEVRSIIASHPDLDSNEKLRLRTIPAFAEGRSAFIDTIIGRADTSFDGQRDRVDKVVVDADKFEEKTKELFDHFKANKVTYKDFLAEFDTLDTLNEKYSERVEKVYEEIDELCQKKQKEVEEKLEKIEKKKEKLDEMVDVELLRVYETERNYRDIAVVKVKFVNNTDERIEALSFDMTLKDKLNNVVAELNCKSNEGFNSTSVGHYSYEKIDDHQMYDKLENVRTSDVTAEVTVDKVNKEGEVISAYSFMEDGLKPTNYEYESPEDPFGYCPYLEEDHELMKKVDRIQKEKEEEVEDRLESFTKFRETLQGVIKRQQPQ